MQAANFPDDLLSFLQLESLVILQIAREQRCDTLVEFGCYDGRALEIAKLLEIRYLGVDINEKAIKTLNRRIANEGLRGSARSIVADINNPAQWSSHIDGNSTLYVIPFNLIGNLSKPRSILNILKERGGYGVLSVFNADPWTTEIRRNYYTACGIGMLGTEPAPFGGVKFCGAGGFVSQSFSHHGFEQFLTECNVTTLSTNKNRIAQCVAVKFTS
jgi:hypothetical protein